MVNSGAPARDDHRASHGLARRGAHTDLVIEEDSDRAGRAIVTVFVDDLEGLVAAIASRGLEPDERVTYSNGVRKAIYRDADGNEIGFGGAAA